MTTRATFRCANCANIVSYNLRNGTKPSKLCDKCDTKNSNKKADHSTLFTKKLKRRFKEMY